MLPFDSCKAKLQLSKPLELLSTWLNSLLEASEKLNPAVCKEWGRARGVRLG